jgi:thiamine biosynthesis lipoprotein
MGTVVSLSLAAEATTTDDAGLGPDPATLALAQAIVALHEADRVFSTWQPQSPMNRLRRGEIELDEAPPEIDEVLELCRRARDASGGWFDPWRMPGGVDPTGLVKGWAAERALAALRGSGAPAGMVNAGGDIAVFGQPSPGEPWRIGIQDPRYEGRVLCVVELAGEGAVATSGTYQRGYHVVDPGSKAPARELLAATVAGSSLAFADALATGLLASGGRALERVAANEEYSALVVDAGGRMRATPGFPVAVELALAGRTPKRHARGVPRALPGRNTLLSRRIP